MADSAELLARARLICGEQHVLTTPTALSVYRSDGVRRPPTSPLPLAVVLPGNAAEVSGLLTACAQTDIGHTVRGAGTSDAGGALPVPGKLMVVLTRLRRILALELDDDRVTVEPGVAPSTLARAVSPTHVFSAPPAGTVGGLAASGDASSALLGLDLVRPDGTPVSLSCGHPGYDVAGAFAGTAGECGIAVSLTLRVAPRR